VMASLSRIGIDLIPTLEQHHSELVGLELYVEFSSQVNGMTTVGETDLFVLGARILSQQVGSFEIDRLVVKEHRPDAFGRKYLFRFVGLLVCVLN